MYFPASVIGWLTKEWYAVSGAVAIFALLGVAATAAGVFRGHLLFTERMNQPGIVAELRRTGRVTIVLDLLIAAALSADAALLLIATPRKVPAVLTVGLAIGTALARLVVEPSTTRAAFPGQVS